MVTKSGTPATGHRVAELRNRAEVSDRMRIGLDFDGVLADVGVLKSWTARTLYGLDIPAGAFNRFTLIATGVFASHEAYDEFLSRVYEDREIAPRAGPVPGALEGVARLLASGHEVRVVTSRTAVALELAREWLRTHGLSALPVTGVGSRASKAAATAGMDLFVDDDLERLEDLTVPHRILFGWEYNGHHTAEELAGVTRVESWADLLGLIETLAAEGGELV